MQPSAEHLALQQALAGRYSIEHELGRGGMGVVFLAREVALDRMVALKLLPPEMAARPGLKERFLREARTVAGLSHPNIVPIFSVDEVDDFVFFSMAYIEGGTLGDRIRERGPLSTKEAVRLIREVSWALGHAHGQGVVHRDVKPDNILLEKDTGRAMVTDFGIAVLAEAAGAEVATEVVGTAEFMSPEQARGGEVDARSDLYSLGCVGFYALTAQVPFSGPTPASILGQHVSRPPPGVASVAPEVPAGLATALDRCLRKDPELRFSGGGALAEALEPEAQPDRELPVPLRVFNRRSREAESTVAWSLLGELMALPVLIGMITSGSPVGTTLMIIVMVALAVLPLGYLLREARRLLRAGFTHDDAIAALVQDVDRKNEEFRFQVGERRTWLDRILKGVGRVGLGVGGMGAVAMSLGLVPFSVTGITVLGWTFWAGGAASLWAELRKRGRGDTMGERLLRLWRSLTGRGLFKLAGVKLDRTAVLVSGAHRPTEVAIGLAADRLFDDLPKETRRELKGLPETVKALEDDAQAMRKQVAELDGVLAEIGDDDPSRPGHEERARVRAGVEATRQKAKDRLRNAVAALEKIRLGLLFMHSGTGTVESMTMDLEAAREVADQMENLLEGHREVERILHERRTTGFFSLEGAPRPTPT